MMNNLRRSAVLGTLVLWGVGVLALPLSFADTADDCGPYTGTVCEAPVDSDTEVLDDGREAPPVEDTEVLGDVREVPLVEDTEAAVTVQSEATTDAGGSVLAVTGANAAVIALVGILLLGTGTMFLRTRRVPVGPTH